MDAYWIPAVNNLGDFGRWAFAEFTYVYDIDSEFDALIEGYVAGAEPTGVIPDYDSMDFKELLAAAPLEGIELTRSRIFRATMNFDVPAGYQRRIRGEERSTLRPKRCNLVRWSGRI